MRWPFFKNADLDREMQHHLETLADLYERQGMTRDEAMHQARVEFGGVERVKDECRDESAWSWLMNIGQDVRFGWRMMRKTPGITLAAVVSLALGIGATTAILTLGFGLLWRPIGVPAPRQLVELMWESKTNPDGLMRGCWCGGFRDGAIQVRDSFAEAAYKSMRNRLAGKAQIAGHINLSVVSANVRGQVLISLARGVTGNFFTVLGLRPFEGRLLIDADDDVTARPVVVVTHRFWTRQLSADPRTVGSTMRVNNTIYTIVGVLPPEFTGIVAAEETDLYTAIQQSPAFLEVMSGQRQRISEWTSKPTTWWMQLIGRRASQVTDEELHTQLQAAFVASWIVQPKSPDATPHLRISDASTGLGGLRRRLGNPIWMLLGLVALVLLVACANIANLLLARAAEREKEVALRVSLGCSTARLVRQFFTESVMLAVIGGSLSIGVAAALGALVTNLVPHSFEGMAVSFTPDVWSLAGTATMTLLTALLFGLYPAWRATQVDSAPALKEGSGSGGTVGRGRWLPARLLVLFQVALGVLLLSSAIVFTTNLNDLVTRNTGFERGHAILFDVRPGEIGYSGDRLRQFYFDLEDRLAALPGVDAASIAMNRPMTGKGFWDDLKLPDKQKASARRHRRGARISSTPSGFPLWPAAR